MAEASETKEDKYAARLKESVDQLRGNVKWTLLAFGAIGTTLLAGSQLSNLGRFQYGDPRLVVALGFALLALIAAACAVGTALKVANTGHVDINDLTDEDRAYIARSTGLLAGYSSAEDIKLQYMDRVNQRFKHLVDGESLETLETDDATLAFLEELIDNILSYVRYNRIMMASQEARRWLFGYSVAAAIGLIGFAWAANPGSEAQTVLLQSPASPAKLTLNATGKATLTPLLGAKCVALPIDVLLLNVSTSGSEVVTIAGKDCPLARFTLTGTMGRFASAAGTTAPSLPAASTAAERSIVWAQVRPDSGGSSGELLARAIVARDAPCPALTVKGTSWPMQTRADGADPDFPIRYCETALPGDSEAVIGGVKLKPRPSVLRRIVVIGDTGCRVTDYTAQQCDSAADWPFFRIAKSASAINPDLVIHVGDYHYREKPCAGRTGCTDSPSGDNWPTWDADFFKPAAPLLTAAPWLMLRGNHEDCSRAGAGWNLLIRPSLGIKPGERCPADTNPDLFAFDRLRMIVPDTASAEGFGREGRVVTYRSQLRALPRSPGKAGDETWLLTHQALAVSYGRNKAGSYDADDMFSRVPETLDAGLREEICSATISPMNTYRQWLAGTVPETNPNDDRPGDQRAERPCLEKTPAKPLAAPDISLVVSGDTHTFQMFVPDQTADKSRPIQLIVGNGGDNLESSRAYPGSDKALLTAAANLFGVPGKLWMRNTFGFAVLERPEGATAWTATLHDVDGKAIAQCSLDRSNAECRDK